MMGGGVEHLGFQLARKVAISKPRTGIKEPDGVRSG